MRVLLDIRHRTTLSGSVSYVYSMLPRLLEGGGRHEFVVLRYAHQQRAGALPCETIVLDQQSPLRQIAYDHVSLPRLQRRAGFDLYHPLKYLGSANPACAQITTLHAITEPYQGEFPGGMLETVYWRHLGGRILRSSTRVVAVSDYLRRFMIERLGIPGERIVVIPNGVDPRFRPVDPVPGDSRSGDRSYRGEGEGEAAPFLLTVGNLFPVKNFLIAVRVLAALARRYPELRLKMAGDTSHSYFRELQQAAADGGVSDRIDYLGYVGTERLVELMNQCTLLLMPSLTEGCPVTLLEAMACGTPVIGSRRGGIPEVGGDAIAMIDDPGDLPAWVDATSRLLEDQEARRRLAVAGLARAAPYTWERAAAATLALYDSLDGGVG